ncbi:unnamed protein product [Allacma fusca]|uniref:Ionotropic glutamate receptor C-terminal domain-containing protein n=1 Tax=Allacma fusca TaxID=39272 RepID=A0A8J2JCB5_9HEXA|nr:unnamed protein product [Allacma fusca]
MILKTLCFYCANGNPSEEIIHLENIFPDLTKNMHKKLTPVSMHYPTPSTQMYLKGKEYVPYGTGGGYLRPVITTSEVMNFTYKLIPAGGGGKRLKNGTWTDHVGNLLYEKTVLASMNVFAINRMPYIDMCSPFEFSSITFCYTVPKPILSWKSIFWPFEISTWIMFLVSTISTISVLKAVNTFASKAFGVQAWSSVFTIWVCVSSILQQNVTKPKSWDIRWFLTSWFLFLVILTQAFSSNLFGFFVSPPLEFFPRSFQDIADLDYLAGITYKGAVFQFFQNAKEGSTVGKVYRKITTNELQKCYDNVFLTSGYVCISLEADITFSRLVKYGDRQGRSNIVLSPAAGFDLASSISVKKRSILYDGVSRVSSSCFENGLTTFWRHRTIEEQRVRRFNEEKAKNITTGSVRTDNAEPLSTRHLVGCMNLYLAGTTLSSIAWALEVAEFKVHQFWIWIASTSWYHFLKQLYIIQISAVKARKVQLFHANALRRRDLIRTRSHLAGARYNGTRTGRRVFLC